MPLTPQFRYNLCIISKIESNESNTPFSACISAHVHSKLHVSFDFTIFNVVLHWLELVLTGFVALNAVSSQLALSWCGLNVFNVGSSMFTCILRDFLRASIVFNLVSL